MDKRYQVFVSSTYADLKDERREVIQALMDMDCIPAGMELFPAADAQQWEFIKKVIDDCDYYLLIIGNRYGSLTADGISYTEKEYDYAISSGQPVLAFVHSKPDSLPVEKSDIAPELRARLDAFRNKVTTGRLVKMWEDPKALPGLVALSLQKTIKTQPRTGWVRASAVSSTDALLEMNDLRKRNEQLVEQLQSAREQQTVTLADLNLAPLTAAVRVTGTYWAVVGGVTAWSVDSTWNQIFALIAPYLISRPNDSEVKDTLSRSLFAYTKLVPRLGSQPYIDDQLFQTIKIQLKAHGLVVVENLKTTGGGMALFWRLTESGERTMIELRTVKGTN